MIYFDLDDINAIAEVETAQQYQLSPEAHALVCSLLAHANDRWRWHRSGEKLTDSEWDSVSAMVSQATQELFEVI